MKIKKHSIGSNLLYLFRDMARVHPVLMVFMVLQAVCSLVTPILGIYLPKAAIDLARAEASPREIFRKVGGLGLLMAHMMALSAMAEQGKNRPQNNMRTYYHKKCFLKSLYCEYGRIESVEGQRSYERARAGLFWGDQSMTTVMSRAAVELFVNVLGFAIYSGILSTLNFTVILLLVALSLVNFFSVKHAHTFEHRKQDEKAGLTNKLNYIQWTADDIRFGKDIRMYGMAPWFIQFRDILLDTFSALQTRIKNRYFLAGAVNAVTLLIRDGIAYTYLIWCITEGRITTGDFVLYFGAVTGFSDFVGNIVNGMNDLHKASLQMDDLRAFLEEETEAEEGTGQIPRDAKITIDFEHVTFSYEKKEEPVLKDFCLHIEGGEKLALVGVNGAGKTTLVKLLCGFMKPDEGRILINGTDTRQFRREELLKLFSTVFQDIYIAPFTVAENVSMKVEAETDMDRVADCLQKAGLYGKIMEYPKGIHSSMIKETEAEEAVSLSGGQQQKLLMARALYKDAPVLILDEPTSALDPVAESETYENFHAFSKDKTAIYISHRLASTRFCDRIVLLEYGRAREVGSHDRLMEQNGEYARMYRVQSQYYQEGRGEEGE